MCFALFAKTFATFTVEGASDCKDRKAGREVSQRRRLAKFPAPFSGRKLYGLDFRH